MILRVDRVGGRARVIIDEERVSRQGWTEIKLWSWLDSNKNVYSMDKVTTAEHSWLFDMSLEL